MGGVFPIVVGVYTGLFAAHWRGRLASGMNAVFSAAIVVLGLAYGRVGEAHWRDLLVAGGLPPILLSFAAYAVVPDPRRVAPFGAADEPAVNNSGLPIAALFVPAVRRRTLLLATMTGLNFFAYQRSTAGSPSI